MSWRRYAAWPLVIESLCAAGIVALDLAALAVEGHQRVEQRQHGKALVAMMARFAFSAKMCDKAESAVLATHAHFLDVARASRQWCALSRAHMLSEPSVGCSVGGAPHVPRQSHRSWHPH